MMYDGGEEAAREEEEEEDAAARVATKKQEPHTEMWGTTRRYNAIVDVYCN